MLPSGQFASDAEYLQQGDDLVLIGTDGATVVVRDYFLSDPPPDLLTPEGGRLTPAMVDSFTPPEAVGQYAQAGDSAAAPIGQATSIVGQVFVVRTNGVRETIGAGDAIYQGDVIETADGGAIDILFVDKTTFALGGDARLAIDKLVYNPETHEGSSSYSILKGMFVFSSGEIAKVNPLDMTVKTTVATIGIRGTKVAGDVKPAGEESKFTILEGEIIVTTDAGYVVLGEANETTFVTGFDAPPTEAVLLDENEIDNFYGDVKRISNDFYGSGSSDGQGLKGEGDEPNLEKLAEELSDLAPAAGPGGEGEGEGGAPEAPALPSPIDPGTGFTPAENDFGLVVGGSGTGGGPDDDDGLVDPLGDSGGRSANGLGQLFDRSGETESVTVRGTEGDDTIIGGAGDDLLAGLGGNDSITGGDGNDHITGGDGDDVVSGGDGDDVIVAGSGGGDDSYDGGDGTDTIIFSSSSAPVTINLETGFADGLETEFDSIANIENVVGGSGDDTITGNASDNSIFGGDGNDGLSGGDGSDTLDGGNGDDGIAGGAGADLIHGGDGDDFGTGGIGDDTIFGGAGEDGLAGNDGDDVIDGGDDADGIDGGEGDDTLRGGGGNDKIVGSAGDDLLEGGVGDDELDGGTGANSVMGDAGDDIGIVTLDQTIDLYDGGVGNDALSLNLTSNKFSETAVVDDFLALRSFVSENADPESDNGAVGVFGALGLKVTNWESLEILVDGEAADLDASTPNLSVLPAAGSEDSAISLDIAATLSDQDGSEILSVIVTDIPVGAKLSSGTENEDGSVTLTAAQLDGLTITPPADSDEDFTLTIKAEAQESSSGAVSTASAVLPVTVLAVSDAPKIFDVEAQSAQAEPVQLIHMLETDTPFSDLQDGASVPADKQNGVEMSDLEVANDHPVTVTFMSETAGFHNTIGYYKIADDGQILDVELIWENASAVGSGGDLVPGVSSATLDVAAGDRISFFIVANGDRLNNFGQFGDGSFEFKEGASAATVQSDDPSLVFVGTDGSERTVSGAVYHTTRIDESVQLNDDGLLHTVSGLDAETGGLTIGFEDLRGLGDRDFDDAVFRVDFGPAIEEFLTPFAVLPDISLSDVDSETLSKAELEIVSGSEADDVLQLEGLSGTGIVVTENGFDATAGVYRLTLSGEASLDAYETALQAVRFANGADDVTPGEREFTISVTDNDGVESEITTVRVDIGSANVLEGTVDADVLLGDAGNDIILGNSGNDLIIGGGGKDALRGDEGDDRMIVSDDSFVLIDGGAGTDTVQIDFTLDLGNVANNTLRGIESFDLGDGSNISLTIGLDDVLAATSGVNALTGNENSLVIRRDGDAEVAVVGADWEESDEFLDTDGDDVAEGYTVFTDNASGAAVYVENVT